MDRYGCFRPNGNEFATSSWMTIENLHIDMNPWVYFDK